MTKTNKITSFNITWTADHEQYWQGHGLVLTDYTHTATGCGDTLRESFDDALEQLIAGPQGEQLSFTDELCNLMLAKLTSQVSSPEILDLDIVTAECPTEGEHPCMVHLSTECNCDPSADCAVCAGEWHYYVSIDVKVEEGEPNNGISN